MGQLVQWPYELGKFSTFLANWGKNEEETISWNLHENAIGDFFNVKLGEYSFFAFGNGADICTQFEGNDSPAITFNIMMFNQKNQLSNLKCSYLLNCSLSFSSLFFNLELPNNFVLSFIVFSTWKKKMIYQLWNLFSWEWKNFHISIGFHSFFFIFKLNFEIWFIFLSFKNCSY